MQPGWGEIQLTVSGVFNCIFNPFLLARFKFHIDRVRLLDGHTPGDALLQQQVTGPDPGVGVEQLMILPEMQDIVEREEAHAVVVCHLGTDRFSTLISPEYLGCVFYRYTILTYTQDVDNGHSTA